MQAEQRELVAQVQHAMQQMQHVAAEHEPEGYRAETDA